MVDAYSGEQRKLADDVLLTLARIAPVARELGSSAVLEALGASVMSGASDAAWLRQAHKERGSLNDVARMQSDLWMGRARGGMSAV